LQSIISSIACLYKPSAMMNIRIKQAMIVLVCSPEANTNKNWWKTTFGLLGSQGKRSKTTIWKILSVCACI